MKNYISLNVNHRDTEDTEKGVLRVQGWYDEDDERFFCL